MRTVAQPLQLVGGVNLNKDARKILPYQAALTKNAFPVISGILGKRNGMSATGIAVTTAGSRRVFVNSWANAPGVTGFLYVADLHIGAASDANRSRILFATDFNKANLAGALSGTYVSIGTPASNYEPTKFFNYRGLVIAIVPGEEGYYVLQPLAAGGYSWIKNTFRFDPAIVNVQTTQINPVTPRNATQYKQRVVWGNFGPGRGNWIAFADIATTTVMQPLFGHSLMSLVGSDVLSLNGRHVEVGAIEGEDITAMQEITLGAVGSALESVLMILTDRSCVLISGDIAYTSETNPVNLFTGPNGRYNENRINYECGCVAQSTLVKSPYGWIWASADDVWLLRGNFPVRIGTNIRPALLNCPATAKRHWSAAYANGVYVLQLVTTTSVSSDLFADVTTYQHEYWYLDLRDGPPQSADDARWFGPMVNSLDTNENVVFSKLLSVKDRDGSERILVPGFIMDTAPSGHRDLILYNVLEGANKDDLVNGTVSANEWQASTDYKVGDLARARVNANTIGKTGRIFYVNEVYERQLAYTGQVGNFTVGQVVTGGTSGARGTIMRDIDSGLTGVLYLNSVTGTFTLGETITDPITGNALANSDGSASGSVSGSTDPTWSTGGTTVDGGLRWSEIQQAAETLGVRQESGRAVGEFTADIRAIDDLLRDNTHEKLIRRVDVNVAAANVMNLSATALLDQGAAPKSLGSLQFGGEAAQGDLFQFNNTIGGTKSRAKSFRPAETELIQCRTAQIKIADSTDYIIDDTNDYFNLVMWANSAGSLNPRNQILQVQLTHGNYSTLDAVLSELVTRINAAITNWQFPNAEWDPDPASVSSAYSGAFPYFTRLSFAYSAFTDLAFGPIFSASDYSSVSLYGSTGTLYTSRAKKLAAMLGFNTGANYTGNAFAFAPTDLTAVPVYTSSSPATLDGTEIVHQYNSKRFDIAGAFVVVQPKAAVPFKSNNRS